MLTQHASNAKQYQFRLLGGQFAGDGSAGDGIIQSKR